MPNNLPKATRRYRKPKKPRERFAFLSKFKTDEAKEAELRRQYIRFQSLNKMADYYHVTRVTVQLAMVHYGIPRNPIGGNYKKNAS